MYFQNGISKKTEKTTYDGIEKPEQILYTVMMRFSEEYLEWFNVFKAEGGYLEFIFVFKKSPLKAKTICVCKESSSADLGL